MQGYTHWYVVCTRGRISAGVQSAGRRLPTSLDFRAEGVTLCDTVIVTGGIGRLLRMGRKHKLQYYITFTTPSLNIGSAKYGWNREGQKDMMAKEIIMRPVLHE